MFILNSKHGDINVYAQTVEQEAILQILAMANSPLGENAHIRIMPDCHAGAGCVIGTTMKITDKICPNLVGVDIGCGVDLIKTDIDFKKHLDELDDIIRKYIPYGLNVHDEEIPFDFSSLLCWNNLPKDIQERAKHAMGTLGGGNHFIEAYDDGSIAVHSGSRNLGLAVAKYYQTLAEKRTEAHNREIIRERMQDIEPKLRETWLKENKISVTRELCYLTGQDMQDYLHDVAIMQQFAELNRYIMLKFIAIAMHGDFYSHIRSVHNYIDIEAGILRKGAISAKKDEILVIPLNMRDGMLICKGKGNPEWNFSAPHGAGRLYSRSKARELFSVDEFAKSMQGIFTTCVSENTLDESPFAYKNYEEIMQCIEPTVEIIRRIKPIYNFKAN